MSSAPPFLHDGARQLELISENFPEGALYQYAATPDGKEWLTYAGGGFMRLFGEMPPGLPTRGQWLTDRIDPAEVNALHAARARSARQLTPFHFETRIANGHAPDRWISLRSQPRALPDGTIVWDGSVIEVTERRRAEESVRRQAEFLATLNQTTLELLGRRNVPDLLQALAERASILLRSPHAEISLLESGDLVLRALSSARDMLGHDRIRRGEPALAWRAVETRLPVVLDRCADHPATRDLFRSADLHAATVFPIVRGSDCVGVLAVAREFNGGPFTSEDLREGMLLAQMAALVLHNAAIHTEAVLEAETRTVELRTSEERFHAVFDQTPVTIALLTVPGFRLVELNAAGLAAFGYARDDVVGRRLQELDLWAVPAQRDEYLAGLLEVGSVAGFEAEMRRRNGETFTVLHNARLMAIAGQTYCVSSLQDISVRKQTEAARDRSLALMRATLESTADAILVVNADGRLQTCNQNFADMWGLDLGRIGDNASEAELLRTILDQLVAPERFLASVREVYARSEDEVFDVLHCKDGRILERYSRPQLISDLPAGRVWSFRDMTHQRAAEAALRESEERFRVLADVSPVGIFSSDAAGRTTFVNRRWCEIAGLTAEEAQGEGWLQVLHPEDRAHVTEIWRQSVQTGGSSTAEFRFRRRDGRVTWLVGQSRAQRHPDGTVSGHVGTITDVTELKAAEEQRKKLEAQARQGRKMEALGTLAGGIAHDFNNILTGTFGFVDLARLELKPDHPAQAWLDRIVTSSQRARELVRQILTFSRKSESERTVQPLQPVIAEALRLVRPALPRSIELVAELSADAPPVRADATQIQQVVVNLATNAWQAMPGGGTLRVALERCTLDAEQAAAHAALKPGEWVRLLVADTGSGMDAATLEHLFEPFFTTKETGAGTGLGLAVVHGILTAHEGAILVRSAPSHGSTFELYFPAATPAPLRPTVDGTGVVRGEGQHVLVVDDDAICGFAVEKMVESLGYRATRCTRPEDALAAFKTTPHAFDALVSDLAMPGMDGAELIEHIIAIRGDVPLLVMTGFVESARLRVLEQFPVRAVLRKPVSRDELARALTQHVPTRS